MLYNTSKAQAVQVEQEERKIPWLSVAVLVGCLVLAALVGVASWGTFLTFYLAALAGGCTWDLLALFGQKQG